MGKANWNWLTAKRSGQSTPQFDIGDVVQIKDFSRLPLAGHFGTVMDIDDNDPGRRYLVFFAGGLRFRYHGYDLIPRMCGQQEIVNSAGMRVLSGIG